MLCGALVAVLALMMLGSWVPAQAATKAPYRAACRLPQAQIHFNHLPTLGEFDGSQMRFARTDVDYYPPSLGGLSISAASATLPIDFPVNGSSIRFFYVQDNYSKYSDDKSGLVGCLDFHLHGSSYVLSHAYEPEGNAVPIIVSMFTLKLARGVGRTLFIIIRWDIENAAMSGTLYDLHVYGSKDITKDVSERDLNNFELSDFIAKVFGASSWPVSGSETVQSAHAYTDKTSIVKRLKQLGYLK